MTKQVSRGSFFEKYSEFPSKLPIIDGNYSRKVYNVHECILYNVPLMIHAWR